jgi:hypothetical protein
MATKAEVYWDGKKGLWRAYIGGKLEAEFEHHDSLVEWAKRFGYTL